MAPPYDDWRPQQQTGRPRRTTTIVVSALLLLLFHDMSWWVDAAAATVDSEPHFMVGGYLPEYRIPYQENDETGPSSSPQDSWLNDTSLLLTDLYLFSTDFDPHSWKSSSSSSSTDNDHDNKWETIVDDLVATDRVCCLDRNRHVRPVQQAQDYRRQHSTDGQPLRVWWTIGGVERSTGFETLMEWSAQQQRQKAKNQNHDNEEEEDCFVQFATFLLHLCRRFDLTGIVLDDQSIHGANRVLEYGSPRNMKHIQKVMQLNRLIETVSTTLHAFHYQLAITIQVSVVLPPRMVQAVNAIHVMAYDMHAPRVDGFDQVLKPTLQAVAQQTDPHKLLLGIPAYGRQVTPPHAQVQTFAEFYDSLSTTTTTFHTPALLSDLVEGIPSEWQGYILDSPRVVQEKVRYAQQELNLQGVFLWELGQDKVLAVVEKEDDNDGGPMAGLLLQAATAAVQRPSLTNTSTPLSSSIKDEL